MMKANFKKSMLVIASAAMILAPTAVFAESHVNANVHADAKAGGIRVSAESETDVKGNNNFCTELAFLSTRALGSVKDRESNFDKDHSAELDKLQQNESEHDSNLEKTRTEADDQRQAEFVKLSATATTDAQKTAIANFEASVTAAIKTRRTAVDAAMTAYRTGVKALITSHQSGVSTATTTFKNSVNAAVNAANASCQAGTSPKTVRASFIAALKAARKQFETDRKTQTDLGPQIQALAKTRNAAIAKALSDFKTSINQARITLKAALGVSATTPTTPTTPTPQPTTGSPDNNTVQGNQ